MSSGDHLGVIPTRAMLLRGQSAPDFTAIVFEERKHVREQKKNKEPNLKAPVDKAVEAVFDIRKARDEVIKFGLSGFETVEKEKAQVARAIKLGAKPPKGVYKNYKVLQEEKKAAKEAKEREQNFQTLGKKSTGEALFSYKKFTKNRRKRKDESEMLKDYGTISAEEKSSLQPSKTSKKRRK